MSLCIEEILSDSNLAAAKASFKGKNDSSGMDGVRVSELGEYWNVNGDKIKKTILEGKYSPGLIRQQEIVNQKGKRRTISLMNTVIVLFFVQFISRWQSCGKEISQLILMHTRIIKERRKPLSRQSHIWKQEISGVRSWILKISLTISTMVS